MTAFLRLPTTSAASGQFSPTDKPLSIDKTQHDVLLNDILHFSRGNSRIPTQPTPIMMPQDRCSRGSEKYETLLDGEMISCFVVGGEKRLCFPQVLNAVLRDIRLEEINRALADLNIHCSRCTNDQLNVLKVTGVLPMSCVSPCGLITKSDAERLVNHLVHSRKLRPKFSPKTPEIQKRSIPVRHRCFGGAKGYFYPDLYTNSSAECVECDQCKNVYPPDRFVLHSHTPRGEKRACHWGFDSANWRAYLHLAKEAEKSPEMLEFLNEIKLKFDPANAALAIRFISRPEDQLLKRKSEETLSLLESVNGKKRRYLLDDAMVSGQSVVNQQLLCDPQVALNSLVAYYQNLLAQRYQNLIADTIQQQQNTVAPPAPGKTETFPPQSRPTTLPLNLTPTPQTSAAKTVVVGLNPTPTPTPQTSAAKTAVAAEGLLALSSADENCRLQKNVKQEISPENCQQERNGRSRIAQTPHAQEPLKKHLLHQFEEQQKRWCVGTEESPEDTCVAAIRVQDERSDSDSSSSGASDCSEVDELSLDRLLSKLVSDKEGLKLIRAKIADSQRSLETKIDTLTAQNHILQQEIAYLRKKQTPGHRKKASPPIQG